MKNKFLLSGLSILTIGLMVLTSCKKDEKTPAKEKTKTDKVVDKWWKLESVKSNMALDLDSNGVSHTDLSKEMPACDWDDLQYYTRAGLIKVNQKTLCNNEVANDWGGEWAWNSDETIIINTQGTTVTNYTVKTLTDTDFTVTTVIGGATVTFAMVPN